MDTFVLVLVLYQPTGRKHAPFECRSGEAVDAGVGRIAGHQARHHICSRFSPPKVP